MELISAHLTKRCSGVTVLFFALFVFFSASIFQTPFLYPEAELAGTTVAKAQDTTDLKEVEQWSVLDSNSNTVGDFIGLRGVGDSALVGFDVDGIQFVVEVGDEGFIGNTGGVFFRSTNCTGTPFIIHKKTLSALVAVAPPGSSVYIQVNPEQEPLDMITGSTFKSEAEGCERQSVEGLELTTAVAVVDLAKIFKPPFTLKLIKILVEE
ncbi:MAG: hypothetical protein V3U74_00415 [Thermodesulfobacteriota bacterium]